MTENRLHRRRVQPRTVPLTAAAAYALLLANITGIPWAAWSGGIIASGNAFGWPHAYMSTSLSESQYDQFADWRTAGFDWNATQNGYVTPGTLPLDGDDVQFFSLGALLTNAAIALAVLTVTAALSEFYHRSRRNQAPFTLLFLMGLVTLCALLTGASRSGCVVCYLTSSRLLWFFPLISVASAMLFLWAVGLLRVTRGIVARITPVPPR